MNALWIAGLFGALFGINLLLETGFSLFAIGLATTVPAAIVLAIKGLTDRQYGHLKILAGVVVAIAFTISVDFAMNNILKPHQQHRIYVTLGLEDDPQGVGYNVNQSKIAIGSGGVKGKGYLNGTQTKLHFVPEQSTDFIFCTVGEEWGFPGYHFCNPSLHRPHAQNDYAGREAAFGIQPDLRIWLHFHPVYSLCNQHWDDHGNAPGDRHPAAFFQLWRVLSLGLYHVPFHLPQAGCQQA